LTILILLNFISKQVFSQILEKKYVDSMLVVIMNTPELREKRVVYNNLVQNIAVDSKSNSIVLMKYALGKDTTLLGKIHFNQALSERLFQINSFDDIIEVNEDIIWNYIDIGDSRALDIANQIEQLSEIYQSSLGRAKSLEWMGLFHEIVNADVETASHYYFKAIALAEENDLECVSDFYHTLGVMFHESDNYEKALVYYQQAYEEAQKQKNLVLQKKCLINMASVNSSLEAFDKAEALFFQSLLIDLSDKTAYNYDFDTYANLGNLYLRQEKYKEAIEFLSKSTEEVPNNPNSEANLRFLIDAKLKIGDTIGLGSLVYRLNRTLPTNSSARERSLLNKTIADYYESIMAYDKAYEYLKDYMNTYAVLIENKKDQTFLELEAKYQNERLSVLIEKRKKQRQFLLLAIIGSTLFSAVLIVFFRNRLKYQKLLTKQQQELQSKKITDLTQKNKILALNSMLEGQEEERMRIAKDLHDSLGGLLSNVKAHFTIIQQEIEKLEKLNITERTNKLIDEACLEVRRISHNMMPHALSIAGLSGALEDLADHMRSINYQVNLEILHLPKKIDQTKQITLYRLIQEILNNIRKHAKAKNLTISLIAYEQNLNLIVEDDGIGFDYGEALANGGLGLKSINSRVEFLDGEIEWDSVKGQGTSISINIPLS
uniref:tetratricopeptide repeat-containing sensor histidine kinase n=1 Tax=Cecembia sp. TaxID=1898110 RepID=UPI0025BB717D